MFFPILPNTSHPTSRQPIQPSETGQPFPWDNCYISVTGTVQARCETTYTEEEQQYVIPVEDMDRIQVLLREDRARRKELFELQNPGQIFPAFPILSEHEEAELQSVSDSSYEGSRAHSAHSSDPESDDGPDADAAADPNADLLVPFFINTTPDTLVVVDLTPDLSTVDTVNDPKGFFEELDALQKSVNTSQVFVPAGC